VVLMTNKQIAAVLAGIADLLDLKGESIFRLRAYQDAARRIESFTQDLSTLYSQDQVPKIPGVGESISTIIRELLQTGSSERYEALKLEIPTGLLELLNVPGLGPKRARKLYGELGITNLAELERAARDHRLRSVPGMGEKLETNIITELDRLSTRGHRLLLGTALPAAERIVDLLRQHPSVVAIEPAGSIRRRQETIGDIDVLAASTDPGATIDAFVHLPVVKETIARGPTKCSVLTFEDLQIDLRVVSPNTFGAALQYFTGSKEHNVHLREVAIRQHRKLSEYGIFQEPDDVRLGGEEEDDLYRLLGLQMMPPELREDQGEIEAAAKGGLPKLIELSDIRGDLHCHTTWSDGVDSLEVMASAAKSLGYQYLAITEHSQGLGIAHGLSMERLVAQRQAIFKFNKASPDFQLLFGIEVNIRADGSLDYPEEAMAQFDIVIASVHGSFSQEREKMTDRILKAVRHPYVDVIGHPTGRIIGERDPYEFDLEAVMNECAAWQVALEINAAPERLDISDVQARRAKKLGVMVAINSDAHVATQFCQMRYGVFTARRGWLERADVLNALPLGEMRERLARKRR
jgi:DNA polymerase (family X)